MKKSEFKKIIKPIVIECLRESLLEDGLISGIISEVVKGINAPSVGEIAEPPQDASFDRMRRNAFTTEKNDKLQNQRNKLMNAVGRESYNGINLFEGTTPGQAPESPTQQSAPLSGQGPSDPGVDINNLFGSVSGHWNAHMSEVKK